MTMFWDVHCTHKMKNWRKLVIRSVWLQPGCANQANSLDIQTASHRLQRAQKQGGHILSIHLSFVPRYLKAVLYDPASSLWFCCWRLDFFLLQVKAELKAVSREKPSQLFWTRWVGWCLLPSRRALVCLMCRGFITKTSRISIFGIWFTHSYALLVLL